MFGGQELFRFRMLGFDIKLDTSWIFIAALIVWWLASGYFRHALPGQTVLFYWVLAIIGAAGFFFSILLHELGHAVTARRFGIPVISVTLLMFGGVTEFTRGPQTPKQAFLIAAAGPFVNFLLGFLFLGLKGLAINLELGLPIVAVVGFLSYMNFLLAVINIIPAFPLDGGKILQAALWKILRNYAKATRIAARIGMLFSYALMAYGSWQLIRGFYFDGLWLFFIAIVLHNAAKSAVQHYKK
ncbi:MAG: site-2 protease family protein [Robiginitomaculum sp.]|nr:site-2 protease family protein [Robiginitomaculum sp.]